MVVKVYYTDWCTYCHVLMDWLDSLDVKYDAINAAGLDDIQSVPIIKIDDIEIIGLDRPAIKKALIKKGIIQ